MNSEFHHAEAVAIIGGADGPSGVFVGGKSKKPPLKIRLRTAVCRQRRKRAAKKITAGARTLDELLAYAEKTYGATACEMCKDSAVGCAYAIKAGDDIFVIEADEAHHTFGVSFSGSKKAMKRFRAIAKDLYIYYGVSENDIRQKTERYLSLLSVLSM